MTTDMIDEPLKTAIKVYDDNLIYFLREQGFRPRRTKKYMENLKKRLDKRGYTIYDITNYTANAKFDNNEIKCTVTPKFILRKKIGDNK